MNGFSIDLRQGWRSLRREPAFSVCVILVLAAGVGTATAMFSVFDAALLRPLPYRAPDRQVHVGSLDGEGHKAPMGSAEFLLLSRSATTVEDFAVYSAHRASVLRIRISHNARRIFPKQRVNERPDHRRAMTATNHVGFADELINTTGSQL